MRDLKKCKISGRIQLLSMERHCLKHTYTPLQNPMVFPGKKYHQPALESHHPWIQTMPISRPLYRVWQPNNPSTRDLKWAEYRNKIRYNLPSAHHLRPFKTLKFRRYSPKTAHHWPVSAMFGPCNWFTWSSWSWKTSGSQKFGLVTTQFSEQIFWSTPYQPNTTKKNDVISTVSFTKNNQKHDHFRVIPIFTRTRAVIMYRSYPHSIILYYINRFKPPWLNHFSAFPIFSCKWGFRKIGVPTHRSIFWDFHCKS